MSPDPNAPGDKQLELIRGLRGVVHAFYLDRTILEELREEESKVRAMGDIEVDNEGFKQALERDSVICIVKDPRFRPPPEPTVILESGNGEIIGEEVFPFTMKKYENRDDVVWLSDGFVLFPKVKADGGIDIGGTLIGMHLKETAVPVRLSLDKIGNAIIICAKTRPKYIGGNRAVYEFDEKYRVKL